MQAHTSSDVSVSLSEADIERLLEHGIIEQGDVTIELFD